VVAGKLLEDDSDGKLFKLAAIEIPYGFALMMRHDAWHCDSTLRNGVFSTSFGFAPGPDARMKAQTVTTYQPLVNHNGTHVLFAA